MRNTKFRQAIYLNGVFSRFHYWGNIDGTFIGPITDNQNWAENSDQFTGLKDKNGVEIYGRDMMSNGDKDARIGIVTWQDGLPYWHFCGTDGLCENFPMEIYPAGVIIGNVHESPELLKES